MVGTDSGSGGGVSAVDTTAAAEEVPATANNAPDQPTASRYSLRKRTRNLPDKENSSANTNENDNDGGDEGATAKGKKPKDSANNSLIQDGYGYVNSTTLTDRDLEALLKQHEEDGIEERAEKKRRLERGYGDDDYPYETPEQPIAFDSLPGPCIEMVFELLPTPRDIFNLAYQSKYLLSHVEKRTDVIVRAAVHANAGNGNKNQTKQMMANVIKMVRDRAIHVPGPIRLLRLVCAKRCERNHNCWDLDLTTKQASSKGMATIRPYGMALCARCANDAGRNIPRWWYHAWARSEARILTHNWSKVIHPTIASDLQIAPGGEKVGPRINAKDVMKICDNHRGDAAKQKEAFAELVEREYGEEGSEEREAYEKAATNLVEIFDKAESDVKVWKDEQARLKGEERTRKHDETVAKRTEKLKPIVAALEAAVADAPLKELIEHEWREDSYNELRFKNAFVKNAMGKLVSAPSSASRRKITAACADVRRKLDILSESEAFTSFSFLSQSSSGSGTSSRVKAKMLQYCQQNLRNLRGIVGCPEVHVWSHGRSKWNDPNNIDDRFFDLLEGGQHYTALLQILEARGALGEIVKKVLVAETSGNLRDHRSLAAEVWKKFAKSRARNEDGSLSDWTSASFNETLASCRREFRIMKTNARDYCNNAAVKSYLAEQEQHPPHWHNYTRQRAIQEIWRPKNTVLRTRHGGWIPENIRNIKPYEVLLDRDFARLLEIHQFYKQYRGSQNVHVPALINNNNN